MRVALVVESFQSSGGGVEQVVWKVAQGLAEAGDEVHVIARRGVEAAGIRLHRISAPTFWQPVRVVAFARGAARALEAPGSGGRFDIVHSFCRSLRMDVFHAGGGTHADYMLHSYGPGGARRRRLSPRHAVQLWLDRQIFDDPHPVIQCVSHMVADQIAERFGVPRSRLAVVYNGVDAERFAPDRNAAARSEIRSELGIGDDRAWLLAGSGWRRKGLETALRALAECKDGGARLWVAGGDAVAPWKALAARLGVAGRVTFLGPRTDLERVYAACDGLLLPTRYDAFGLVCLEAAAAARPVITSARAGASELLRDAGDVIEDPSDAVAFARAMERMSDPARRARLGAVGRCTAERHDWPRHVAELRALYERVRPR